MFSVIAQSQAVLKEPDLNRTLHVLRLELANKRAKQQENMKMMKDRNEQQHANLVKMMKRCDVTSLILYSQSDDFTFDIAYACQEATTLFHELHARTMPYDEIKSTMETEIGRYDSLIFALKQIPPSTDTARTAEVVELESLLKHVEVAEEDPSVQNKIIDALNITDQAPEKPEVKQPFLLDNDGIADRNQCIIYADSLRENIMIMLEQLEDDNQHYQEVAARIAKLNDYAQKKYTSLQQSIFINPGTNYFTMLQRLPMQLQRAKRDVDTKYHPLEDVNKNGKHVPYRSEWRGPIVLFASIFMIIYLFVAFVISNIIFRWFIPKKHRTTKFMHKRAMLILIAALVIFIVAVMCIRLFIEHNLMLMATSLMVEMAWMVLVIYISLAIRLNEEQSKEGAKLYAPFILISVIVICFRIVLIPNTLVNIIFPPILLIFTIWQYIILSKCKKIVPTSDKIYCYISLIAMLAACVMAWVGYALMAVQLLVWWMFQLAAIATITCCYDLMEMYENSGMLKRVKRSHGKGLDNEEILRMMRRGDFIDKTWFYDFVNKALVPVCAVFSFLFSVYFAAEIFDLRDLCFKWFLHPIVIKGIATFSAFKLCLAVALYFIFKYLNYVIRASWFLFRKSMNENFNATLATNVINLIVWGIYIIAVFLMLQVPSSGIAIVTGGLATGMGFASKSLLENIFYGISLMSGRVRVGDYIECDGITGKVESITYQSTQLITLDGSVVAILNSDLFSKNFKNLTRNHQYELIKIPFGVAYGSNVDEVRKMIIEGVSPLCKKTDDGRDIINPNNPISVSFSDFGASSVDLFLVAWVLVDQRISFTAKAKEKIYEVLNNNGIEIPFPQQDVYIRSITKEQ